MATRASAKRRREREFSEPIEWPWARGTIWLGGRRHPARRQRTGDGGYRYRLLLMDEWASVTDPSAIRTWVGEVT